MKVNFDPGSQDPTADLQIIPLLRERVGEGECGLNDTAC
jgi:hypothetical protein